VKGIVLEIVAFSNSTGMHNLFLVDGQLGCPGKKGCQQVCLRWLFSLAMLNCIAKS